MQDPTPIPCATPFLCGLNQAEIWLEVVASDTDRAAEYLRAQDYTRRDDIEPLPEGMRAFLIVRPTNLIHLVLL